MQDKPVLIGKISGCHGVRGWVKVYSYTRPRENITQYRRWLIDGVPHKVTVAKHGKSVIAKIEGIDDRDTAVKLVDKDIYLPRESLPAPEEGQYYWSDLIGMVVENTEGEAFGTVSKLLETGAHDVLVIKGEDRERLIPFVMNTYIKDVDLDAGRIRVDWHRDD